MRKDFGISAEDEAEIRRFISRWRADGITRNQAKASIAYSMVTMYIQHGDPLRSYVEMRTAQAFELIDDIFNETH